jgi:hypothetical protein
MIKKTLEFKNFRGEKETGEFYFNMSEGELIKLQLSAIDQKTESFQDKLNKIANGLQGRELVNVIDDLVLNSYGVKSTDGKNFRKNPQVLEDFTSSNAYSALIKELFTDAGKLAEFVNGVVPADLAESTKAEAEQMSAREKAEQALAAKGGFNSKQETLKSTAVVEPTLPEELPASAPILETTPEAPAAVVDLNSLSHEELVAFAQRQQTASVVG